MQEQLLQLISWAQEKGAQETEIFYEDVKSSEIKVYQGEVESLISSHPRGMGIRLFKEGRMGFAYTSDFTPSSQCQAVEQALENAQVVQKNPLKALPPLYETYPEMDFYNPLLEKEKVSRKVDFLLELEEQALGYEERIHSAPEVGFRDANRRVILVNSRGLNLEFKRSLCYAYLVVLAREGEDVQTGVAITHGRALLDLELGKTVETACDEALILLGAGQIPSQRAPVIFKPEVGAQILDVIGDALTAEAIQKKRSPFAQKLGEVVASPQVTLVDDGLLPQGLASQPFDGEGVPSSKTRVIQEGVLSTYLYDSYTARKDGVQSTGNAVRSSYKGFPGVAPTNFFLAPGKMSRKDLLAGVEKGFYVLDVSGLHSGTNSISGDFSMGASGRWIKDGRFRESVREVTIAGNLMDFLLHIQGVAWDLTFNPLAGSAGAPTFLVENLSIGGR